MDGLLSSIKHIGSFEVLCAQDACDIGNLLARNGYLNYGNMLHRYADEIEKLLLNIQKQEWAAEQRDEQ